MRRAFAVGASVSLVCFALLFWGIGKVLLPLLPQLADSPWIEPLGWIIALLSAVVAVFARRRKQRRKHQTPAAERLEHPAG
jgi:hypothetical protein